MVPPALPKAGNYDVYAWWTYANSRSRNVVYRLELGGTPYDVTVDQHYSLFASQWYRLGTFTYDGISTAKVSISIDSPTVNVNADAVRFVYQSEEEPWPVATCPCDGYYNRAIQKYLALGGKMRSQDNVQCEENQDWTVSRYITYLDDGTRLSLNLWLDVGEWQSVPDIDVVCFATVNNLTNGTVIYNRRQDMVGFDAELPCRASVLDVCKDDPP